MWFATRHEHSGAAADSSSGFSDRFIDYANQWNFEIEFLYQPRTLVDAALADRTAAIGATHNGVSAMALPEKAYLEITLKIDAAERASAAAIYAKYKQPFL